MVVLRNLWSPAHDEDANKPAFLDELRDAMSFCSGPWMLAGDFYIKISSEDKSNDNANRALIGRFRRFVNDEMELKEILLCWIVVILGRMREIPPLVKLDRVFVYYGLGRYISSLCFQSHAMR